MAAGYIPDADGAFHAWQANFVAYVEKHVAELGLTADDVIALFAGKSAWSKPYQDHVAKRAAAAAARVAKTAGRADYEALLRSVVRRIQVFDGTTDGDRAALGITIRDPALTASEAPGSRPVVVVDFSKRLRHVIRFGDERTPTRRARPRGALGAEVWVKVSPPGADPPADPAELTFLSLATRPPAIAEYTGADAGKTAHYLLRWLSTRGEAGPWSETASATIGA